MNIVYVIDLNGIVNESDINVPYLKGLQYKSINPYELDVNVIRTFHDEVVLQPQYSNQEIEKHLFMFVIKNDRDVLPSLSRCINNIQSDKNHFNMEQYEIHIVCNYIIENDIEGFSIDYYEEKMSCLKDNSVCVYSWFLDKYDYSGDKPVIDVRRSHAIARLAGMLCNHRGDLHLLQMNTDKSPVYNLFGDSSVLYNETERDRVVSHFYYFKCLQYMLNIPDVKLDDYLKEHVIPFKNNIAELDKRIDSTSDLFLRDQRIPIEASLITEKTQGLLIKSSDDDNEYLVNATDNKLVFIDELSHNQRWQLEGTDEFITEYRNRVVIEKEDQETITDDFLQALHDKLVIHGRIRFNEINNEVSKSRREHIKSFKQHVDEHLLKFLNKRDSNNYTEMEEFLSAPIAIRHCSNIDYGIAFMEYLESGNGDYLIDKNVSVGDTNFSVIKNSLEIEENKRLLKYEEKRKEVEGKYYQGSDGKSSVIKNSFNLIDKEIKRLKEVIRLCNYQLAHWIDPDSKKKLTVRSRSTISICSGFLGAFIWLYVCKKFIAPINDYIASFLKYSFSAITGSIDNNASDWAERCYKYLQNGVFFALLLTGIIVGLIMIIKVVLIRKNAEKDLKTTKERKEILINNCVKEMQDLTTLRYQHLLAYHGLKTILELMQFVQWKKEDLVKFRKTLFKLMIKYKLSVPEKTEDKQNDFNTIELTDIDVRRMLFGTEDNRRPVPYCFARGGVTMSEAFDNFNQKKVKFETTRFDGHHGSLNEFDQVAVENEVIACRKEDEESGITYTTLNATSVLPNTEGVEMEDVHQGYCGDCYFMATLASIANMNPEYIIGKNGMIEELGEDHRFFRVKFFDKDGNRFNVDIDNKFWNLKGTPYYARAGKSENQDAEGAIYDPWVMAVEKAWAKANEGGYDGIEGASSDGQERVRMMEYSYAVTGKTAFYCMTKNVPDRKRLFDMMKKHVNEDKLPITLYSASEDDSYFANKDVNLVCNHAYALKSVNEDNTFDIFNPWNNYSSDSDIKGKHYERVSIDFIKDNFDVIVFFGIKEADFASFERDLTNNASEKEVSEEIERILKEKLIQLKLDVHNLEDLMTEDVMENAFIYSSYLFSKNRMRDERGINKDEKHLIYIEGSKRCVTAYKNMIEYIESRGHHAVLPLVGDVDDEQIITLFRLSPHYVLSNFN